ncbi:MAG TPA: hypothetical protein VK724_02560 [Bryobacteraceae bacterium]|jgi:hypothetical protein|nr:hypothetical protein [Bryobacteraceae bacterium]
MTPPVAPVPQAKKSNVLLWVLIGVGGFFALIIVVVLAAGLFVAHKIKQGTFEYKSPDGSVQFGGAAKTPSWIPEYPGSNPKSIFSANTKDVRSGTFMFTTKDSADHVVQYYRDQLEGSGFTITTVTNSGRSHMMTAADQSKDRTVTVAAGGQGNETSVSVTYTKK